MTHQKGGGLQIETCGKCRNASHTHTRAHTLCNYKNIYISLKAMKLQLPTRKCGFCCLLLITRPVRRRNLNVPHAARPHTAPRL